MADFWGDLGNNIGNAFSGLGKFISGAPGSNSSGGYDPSSGSMVPGMGNADIAPAAASAPASPAPASAPAGLAPTSSTGADSGQSPYLSSTTSGNSSPDMNSTIMHMSQQLMGAPDYSGVIQALANFKPMDFVGLAQQRYNNMLGAVHQNQAMVNNQYDQVADNLNGLYTTDSNAARLGDNNILQHIAQDQSNAVQGSANNAVQSLAALRNAELANRGGATGDWVSDPVAAATAGVVQNAQQEANNAQASAASKTELNNEMADAMKTQGNAAIGQLQNGRLAYNASVGKYLTDLASQENQLEYQAQQQNYENAMNRLMAGANLAHEQYGDLTQRVSAVAGNRGLPEFMQAGAQDTTATANLLKALQANQAIDPFQSAVARAGQYGPQVQDALTSALGNMGLTPGTKPTADDIYQYMAKNNSSGIPTDTLLQAAQDYSASKAVPVGTDLSSIADQLNSLYSSSN